MRRSVLLVLVATGFAVAFSGCGASQAVDPVARAATDTARVPGYRISASMTISSSTFSGGELTMSGIFDRAKRLGRLTAFENVAGHHLHFDAVFARTTFYARFFGLPQMQAVTHGKPWVKIDLKRALSAAGLGGLSLTGTDPSQFVDYLRAVSSSASRLGTATVRGVSTTHYHATVDLDRYVNLVPSSQRAVARRSVSVLEAALGTHVMPIDAWIDSHRLVRRTALSFPECAAGQRLRLQMTEDLYDYGPQPQPRIPPADETYDLTPLLSAALHGTPPSCS